MGELHHVPPLSTKKTGWSCRMKSALSRSSPSAVFPKRGRPHAEQLEADAQEQVKVGRRGRGVARKPHPRGQFVVREDADSATLAAWTPLTLCYQSKNEERKTILVSATRVLQTGAQQIKAGSWSGTCSPRRHAAATGTGLLLKDNEPYLNSKQLPVSIEFTAAHRRPLVISLPRGNSIENGAADGRSMPPSTHIPSE